MVRSAYPSSCSDDAARNLLKIVTVAALLAFPALMVLSVVSASTDAIPDPSPLPRFPYPFVNNGTFNGSMVVALSQPHPPSGAASTIDVVGAVPVAGSMAKVGVRGFPHPRLDIDAAQSDGMNITITEKGHLLTFGGRGVNWVTRYYNDLPGPLGFPVRQFPTKGVCTTDAVGNPVHCYQRKLDPISGVLIDYGYTSILFDREGVRAVMVIAGLSGYATRAESQLIALRAGTVLTGTGTITELMDLNNDGKYETFQVVDGTGLAQIMPAPEPFPDPSALIMETFVIALSQPHGVAGAASTIDVVGGMPLAVRNSRRTPGLVWSALDIEVANPNATVILPGVGNLISFGGRGVNLVTHYYNDNRLVPIVVVPGKGVTVDGTTYYQRRGDYFHGTPVVDYGYRAEAIDPLVNRHIMIAAGLSGYATRGITILLAQDAGTTWTGTGTVTALGDSQGDGSFEVYQVVDGSGGAIPMPHPEPFPSL